MDSSCIKELGVQTRKGDFQDVVGESEVVRTYKLSGLHLRLHRSALGRQERQPRHQLWSLILVFFLDIFYIIKKMSKKDV